MNNKPHSPVGILWLLALVVFTPIVGLAINYNIVSGRSVLLLLIYTIVLLVPYIITQKRSLYICATSLLFADGLVNLFHWIVVKCPLNASSIFVFLNTNINEASEFMTIKATPLLLLLIPYTALFILALKHIPPLPFKTKKEKIVWIAVWIFIAVFFVDNIIHQRFLRLAVPEVERAIISFYNESQEYNNLKNRELLNLDTKLSSSDSTMVVVIIGESCNRNHMSIYGYNRKTTPCLESRDDIYVFDNVVSANSGTLKSIMNIMTESNNERPRPLDSCIHIFDVLHSSAYKSYWLSNQSPIGLWDNGVTNLAQNADVTKFVNITANSSMESTQMASFDQNLFAPLESAITDDGKHKLIFLHLMGCHTQYSKRYPSEYAIFEPSTNKRTQIINSYDNAIYYNDYVVDSIFSMLDIYSQSKPQVRITALYISDHGENVYDEGEYCGHDYAGKIPNANIEIPFLLWLSPAQKKYWENNHPPSHQRLNTPYMIDDLFHTIIDIAGISTPCFDSSRSFVNTAYDSTRLRLLEDGNVYEK